MVMEAFDLAALGALVGLLVLIHTIFTRRKQRPHALQRKFAPASLSRPLAPRSDVLSVPAVRRVPIHRTPRWQRPVTVRARALNATGTEYFAPYEPTDEPIGTTQSLGTDTDWAPDAWRAYPAYQMPNYPDPEEVVRVEAELRNRAPLVFAGECRQLFSKLAAAQQGQAFVLMGGDCAESFDEFNVDKVRDSFRLILQMALVLTYGGSKPVVKIGRMAGQFAKPRSSDTEVIDGVEYPAYRGDNVNGEEATMEARTPDPNRMVLAYNQCAQTINILRAFAVGGYADLNRLQAWNLDFVKGTPQGSVYREFCAKVDESLRFMNAIGVGSSEATRSTQFYTGHECLLLPYEEALTRKDSTTGRWYDCSAHFLWVGERTRQPGHAHLEFVRGIGNPLGVKIGPTCTPEDLIDILDTFNPLNIPGRVTLITRMGAEGIREKLPALVKTVQKNGKHVLWVSDPVHGNTYKAENGYKTRDFNAIKAELVAFFKVHRECGTHAGGVHIEMTGQNVTECVGGETHRVNEEDLPDRYVTHCDPRLNAEQALELAFSMAEEMRAAQGLPPLDASQES